ncbi:hypothetical protein OOK31_10590 [Streptomyces sp. NBC_00249]|uniref:hypothetical protein n=1 Tax=Streptomyces sp. NBC_00249 TaxID=2975690 RepID=UPI0022530D5B|nr:hypothetical protein [Streptomyces sp. NBC_00249]MCX5194340.1 hypothetical protein [Streptomyces sp. NBC_00249]
MTDLYDIWLRAGAAQQIDLWAGYLAFRHRDSPQSRRELDGYAAAGRAAVASGDTDEAFTCGYELRERAERWAGNPHHPAEPGAAEHDRRVWDYAKDLLRAELPPGELNIPEAGWTASMASYALRKLCALPAADADARADAHYLAGRVAMAVEFGHLPAARAELERLRELAARYADPDEE